LVVSAVDAPTTANSGQSLQVSWTVTNQGIATTNTSAWNDTVFLASDPAGTNIVTSLGSFSQLGALAVGGSYQQAEQVTLPNGLHGTFYLVVRTGGPYEFIYTNNNSRVSGPIQVTLTPWADLAVTGVTGPTAAIGGSQVEVSWTVANQ